MSTMPSAEEATIRNAVARTMAALRHDYQRPLDDDAQAALGDHLSRVIFSALSITAHINPLILGWAPKPGEPVLVENVLFSGPSKATGLPALEEVSNIVALVAAPSMPGAFEEERLFHASELSLEVVGRLLHARLLNLNINVLVKDILAATLSLPVNELPTMLVSKVEKSFLMYTNGDLDLPVLFSRVCSGLSQYPFAASFRLGEEALASIVLEGLRFKDEDLLPLWSDDPLNGFSWK